MKTIKEKIAEALLSVKWDAVTRLTASDYAQAALDVMLAELKNDESFEDWFDCNIRHRVTSVHAAAKRAWKDSAWRLICPK